MNTVLSVKTDKETKAAAQEVAKSMGLTLSALINSYLKQVVATRRVELYAPEPMTPELEAVIAEVDADIKAGKNLSPRFTSEKEAREWLESQ
jgi:addiction module RelB/DinJ family antitoxin